MKKTLILLGVMVFTGLLWYSFYLFEKKIPSAGLNSGISSPNYPSLSVTTSNGVLLTGVGTTTPRSSFHVSSTTPPSGAFATTTSDWSDSTTTSRSCWNFRDATGTQESFYFAGATIIVEPNRCK